ncbi:MAG: hypothetical protein ABIH69_07615, partial [bacterium]
MKRFVFILTVISFFIGSALASGFKIVNGPTGSYYCLETTNNQVVKINSANKVLYAYGGSEKFLSPQGIAVNNEKIFLADTGNKRVVELIDDGTAFNFVNVLPKPTKIWAPTALSFDSSGD